MIVALFFFLFLFLCLFVCYFIFYATFRYVLGHYFVACFFFWFSLQHIGFIHWLGNQIDVGPNSFKPENSNKKVKYLCFFAFRRERENSNVIIYYCRTTMLMRRIGATKTMCYFISNSFNNNKYDFNMYLSDPSHSMAWEHIFRFCYFCLCLAGWLGWAVSVCRFISMETCL